MPLKYYVNHQLQVSTQWGKKVSSMSILVDCVQDIPFFSERSDKAVCSTYPGWEVYWSWRMLDAPHNLFL